MISNYIQNVSKYCIIYIIVRDVVESGVKQELQDVGERVKGERVGVFERAADINGGYSLNQ